MWLVTGAGGMLGTELVARLRAAGAEVFAAARGDLDVLDGAAVRRVIGSCMPSTVVNCAGWTAVDDAEAHEDAARAVNGLAVGVLAEACASYGAALIQISTDYVFSGTASEPYPEGAPTSPVNAYGRTKLLGEKAVLAYRKGYVLRTAWLYGAHGPNFVRTMVRLAGERDTVDVVDDQHGQPTWTGDLADRIIALADAAPAPGVYHATGSGRTTWYGLARELFTLLGHDPARVRPTMTANFPRPAPRPAFSVLGHDRWAEAGLSPMRDWRTALHAAWPTLKP